MQNTKTILLGMMMGLLVAPAFAEDEGAMIDADAMNDLQKMGAYLRTLKDFRVQIITTSKIVLDDGQKLQSDGKVDLLARLLNGLRANDVSDTLERMCFQDGKNFTLFGKRTNMYASVEARDTIGKLIDKQIWIGNGVIHFVDAVILPE